MILVSFNTGGNVNNDANIYSSESTAVEAFFEGAQNVYKGATENFSNKKVGNERNWNLYKA